MKPKLTLEALIVCPACETTVCKLWSQPTGNEGVSINVLTDPDDCVMAQGVKVCADCGTALERRHAPV